MTKSSYISPSKKKLPPLNININSQILFTDSEIQKNITGKNEINQN